MSFETRLEFCEISLSVGQGEGSLDFVLEWGVMDLITADGRKLHYHGLQWAAMFMLCDAMHAWGLGVMHEGPRSELQHWEEKFSGAEYIIVGVGCGVRGSGKITLEIEK